MTSAEIVVEFVRSRKDLLQEVRRVVSDPFRAPEMRVELGREAIMASLSEVTPEERQSLDRMRGNGAVDWTEVTTLILKGG